MPRNTETSISEPLPCICDRCGRPVDPGSMTQMKINEDDHGFVCLACLDVILADVGQRIRRQAQEVVRKRYGLD